MSEKLRNFFLSAWEQDTIEEFLPTLKYPEHNREVTFFVTWDYEPYLHLDDEEKELAADKEFFTNFEIELDKHLDDFKECYLQDWDAEWTDLCDPTGRPLGKYEQCLTFTFKLFYAQYDG